MKIFHKIIILALIMLTHSAETGAQEHDLRIYTKAGVKFNITEKLSNTSDLELRTKNYFQNIGSFRFNTSFGYKFNKYFNMALGYAFIGSPKSSELDMRNRYWIDATGNISVSNFTFSLRERFQQTFGMGENLVLLRSELKGQYSIPNTIFKPFISCEPHIFLFNELKGIREIRFNVGTGIAINKHNDLQVYGRYVYNSHKILTSNYFVLGINYYYKF